MTDTPDDDVDPLRAPTDAVLELVDIGVRGVLAKRAGDDAEALAQADQVAAYLERLSTDQLRILLLAATRIIATDVLADLDDAIASGDDLERWADL